ncbi:glycosyltransferase family 2 protein [Gorillibacterium sp. CAU 1737]|uniref:glycosyltransferase family 2 protein n=1 Tax=Gorillibacterium sp. CAU 1737 TaxID=3140362 RepID=UPI003261ABF8
MASRISLCMIVRNEERHLSRCLNSVCPHVDEIIVVDTGSTDRTREIAASYTEQIHNYRWDDHFAEARNYAMSLATGDWLLWMDADEVLEGGKELRKLDEPSFERDLLLTILTLHETAVSPGQQEMYKMEQPRLFRNRQGLSFRYRIHEMLNIEDVLPQGPWNQEIRSFPMVLVHEGYREDTTQTAFKQQRNLSLLHKTIEQKEEHPWLEYHLASEWYRMGLYPDTIQAVNLSIQRFLKAGQLPPPLLYKLKYSALLAAGEWKIASAGIEKAIHLYPDYVDLHYAKGSVRMAEQRWEEAALAFEECLRLGESQTRYLIQCGTGSFLAREALSECRQKKGPGEAPGQG